VKQHSLYLRRYVDRLQQSGRYTFVRDEALKELKMSPVALKLAARRLSLQGRLISPRRGFFVIVPLEYKSAGSPPPSWFIDQLMEFESERYYVGLLSAAALHGAAHQQPQEFQVVAGRQMRPAAVGRSRIRFLLKKHIKRTETIPLKTETGAMKVSTPESTALDLVRYAAHAGGLNNIATILSDLAEKIDPQHLVAAARREDDLPSAQRLGFLLEHIGEEAKSKPLAEWIKNSRARIVSLRPGGPTLRARRSTRWKIMANEEVEVPE
jgi:predicted transcriptional regulator of viral defense system